MSETLLTGALNKVHLLINFGEPYKKKIGTVYKDSSILWGTNTGHLNATQCGAEVPRNFLDMTLVVY